MKKLLIMIAAMLIGGAAMCEDVWVNGYTRKDGTYVNGHYRSSPNAYNWDNKSYKEDQPAYNKTYGDTNRSSNWYQPSETRYQDNNKDNDYQTNTKKKSSSYNWYGD